MRSTMRFVAVAVALSWLALAASGASAAPGKGSKGVRGSGGGKPATVSARVQMVSRAAGALEKLGLYHGPTNGRWNPELHSALEGYQRSRGLKPTGRLNRETRLALGLDGERPARPAGAASAKGAEGDTQAP